MITNEPIITSTGYYMSLDTNGISPSLLSRDYKDPMILCMGFDGYNRTVTGDVSKTLDAISRGQYPTLRGSDARAGHQNGYLYTVWDGSQIVPTLTANNAGGGQRMPDKDNFNCLLIGVDDG